MELYLIRHTKVDISQGICYGQSDVPAVENIETEKDIILNKLALKPIDIIYSSPLSRCFLLADKLSKSLNAGVVTDKRLMELNFGKWELKPWDDISKTEEARKWFNDYVNIPCPNGESFAALLIRVRAFIEFLKNDTNDNNVLIVTHGGVIRAFNSILNNVEPVKAFALRVNFGDVVVYTL